MSRNSELRGEASPARPSALWGDGAPGVSPDRCPVVLLPGYVCSSRVLLPMERRIRRRLRRPVMRIDLGLGDIRESASSVYELLERRASAEPFHYVDVVAHSMGGLVAAYLLKALDRGRRIRRVITLGTPHRGTPLAIAGVLFFGLVSRAVWQMVPRSPLLRQLDELSVPTGSHLIAVEAHEDGVVPRGYARLAPCRGQRNARLTGVGHIDLLHTQQSLSMVCTLLESANLSTLEQPPRPTGDAAKRGSHLHRLGENAPVKWVARQRVPLLESPPATGG